MPDEIYIHSEYRDDGKPPRSKRLIAICSWSWGPSHSRSDMYFISGSVNKREWRLWIKPTNPDLGRYWCNNVLLRLEKPISLSDAATILITEAWSAEWLADASPGCDFSVDAEGILDNNTLIEIGLRVFV